MEGLNKGERINFLCDAGLGEPILQRMRVKLSRVRKEMIRKGRRVKHFKMHSSVHPHTEGGKRFDSVIVWNSQSETQRTLETLEDLIGHGQNI
jgi:hypothetical protein